MCRRAAAQNGTASRIENDEPCEYRGVTVKPAFPRDGEAKNERARTNKGIQADAGGRGTPGGEAKNCLFSRNSATGTSLGR